MNTRTKLYISSWTASIMMLMAVFSKPIQIPELFQWVLFICASVLAGLTLHLSKRLKREETQRRETISGPEGEPTESRRKARMGVFISMGFGTAVALCSPLWMPLTGTTLGFMGDLIVGIITAAVVCTMCGLQLRKL